MTKSIKITQFVFISVIALFFTACSGAPTTPAQTPTVIMSGYVQKGPFILGSTIEVQELNNSLVPTGDIFSLQTDDDMGSFTMSDTIDSNYVEIIGTGYYFNEVEGAISLSTITLRTLADISETEISSGEIDVRVNILTTLSKARVEYLINGGETYSDARTQAEEDVLESVFHIDESGLNEFNEMDITQTGNSNAILLAVSVILQGSNTVGELSELINNIISDVETDGTVDSAATILELKNNAMALSLAKIRSNLEARYAATGATGAVVPNFEDYIDSDGDGIINKNDDDTFVWIWRGNSAGFGHDRLYHTAMAFDDGSGEKLWLMGGLDNFDLELIEVTLGDPMNDVWYSSDGVDWTQASDADWTARYGHAGVEFNDRIWVIEGYGSSGDVWSSPDGVSWTQTTGIEYWTERYNHASVVFDNKMWIMGGLLIFGGGFTNSISYSSDGANWELAEPTGEGVCWPARSGHTSVVFNDKIWVIGGMSSDGYNNDVWYSSDGANWTQATAAAGWAARAGHTSVVFDGKMWVIGGSNDGLTPNLSDIWYSSDGETWTQQTPEITGWTARNASAITVFNSGLWIIGGVEEDSPDYNDVWEFLNYTDYSSELE